MKEEQSRRERTSLLDQRTLLPNAALCWMNNIHALHLAVLGTHYLLPLSFTSSFMRPIRCFPELSISIYRVTNKEDRPATALLTLLVACK